MQSTPFELNNKIFKAGAGAGKTTRLVREVYEFYQYFKSKNKKAPRVALTTFTRKATQELRERLMLFATVNSDEEFLEFVLSKSKLQISTIHGFLQIFLRQYAQLLELDPGFNFASESEIFKASKRIMKKIITKEERYLKLVEEINFKDLVKVAIKHSGYKLIYEDFKAPDSEYFDKLKKSILNSYKERYLSLGQRISSETNDTKWVEYSQNLKHVASLLRGSGSLEEIQEYLKSFRKPPHSAKKTVVSDYTNEMCEDLKKEFKELDPVLFDDEVINYDVEINGVFNEIIHEFGDELLHWKKSHGKISMSDLESLSLILAKKFPIETASFGHSYDYWLIDEYQDTSPLQVQLLNSMIGDKYKFIVGDPQQSIYFFRGARSEVFFEEIELVKQKDGLFEDLITNYRSSPKVMSFINHFFDFYSTKFQKMKIGSELESEFNAGFFSFAQSEEEQSRAIAGQVLDLLEKGVVPNQIAIIARNNSLLKRISENFLKAKIPFILHSAQGFQERRETLDALAILKFLSVPFDNINLLTLLRSPWFRIQDEKIISVIKNEKGNYWTHFLKASLSNSSDYYSILELKNYLDMSKEIGISVTFEKILAQKGFYDLSHHYDSSGRRESNVWKLLTQLKAADYKAGFNYVHFIEKHNVKVDLENLDQDSDAVSSLEPDRVNLMTVHMSKGLEFDHVFIPYIEKEANLSKFSNYVVDEKSGVWSLNLKGKKETSSNLFTKSILKNVREQELAEADRLLYVAMTRARKSIHFFASNKPKHGSWLKNISMDLSHGVHDLEEFSYEVVSKEYADAITNVQSIKRVDVRKPYTLKEKKQVSEGVAVTQMLKQKSGSANLLDLLATAEYGTKIHKLLEALKYKNENIFLDSMADERDGAEKTLNYIKNLKDVPLEEILQNGYAEWGYLYQQDGQKIAGQIDLWGMVNNEAWIIDYKTGSSRYKDTAFEQLREYAKAIKNFVSIEKIHLIALYPNEKKYFKEEVLI